MKRYRFRLEQVLKVRRIELERAEGEVMRARGEVAAAEHRTAERERTYQELSRQPVGGTLADLAARREQQKLVADAILAARMATQIAHQQLRQRIAEWSDADQKVRLLEQLDERHRDRHRAELLTEEQHELDDLVTSRQGRDR